MPEETTPLADAAEAAAEADVTAELAAADAADVPVDRPEPELSDAAKWARDKGLRLDPDGTLDPGHLAAYEADVLYREQIAAGK